MNESKVYLRSHALPSVAVALKKHERVSGTSAFRVCGVRRSGPKKSNHVLTLRAGDFREKFNFELASAEDQVELSVKAIERAARTGLRFNGKIYGFGFRHAVRMENEGRGENSI